MTITAVDVRHKLEKMEEKADYHYSPAAATKKLAEATLLMAYEIARIADFIDPFFKKGKLEHLTQQARKEAADGRKRKEPIDDAA